MFNLVNLVTNINVCKCFKSAHPRVATVLEPRYPVLILGLQFVVTSAFAVLMLVSRQYVHFCSFDVRSAEVSLLLLFFAKVILSFLFCLSGKFPRLRSLLVAVKGEIQMDTEMVAM